jgi:hypothetical protein
MLLCNYMVNFVWEEADRWLATVFAPAAGTQNYGAA